MEQASVLENPKYSYLVKKQPVFFRIWKKLFYLYSKFVFLWYTPLKVYGRENIPDGDKSTQTVGSFFGKYIFKL